MNCRFFLETSKRLAANQQPLCKWVIPLRYCSRYSSKNSADFATGDSNTFLMAPNTVRLSQSRSYQVCTMRLEDSGKDEVPSKNTETPADSDQPDDCPEWQNPLHHNNPEMQKMFEEDFGPGEEMPTNPLPPIDGGAPPHIKDLAEDILHLNMLEMSELVKMVQEHFGISDDDVDGLDLMMASAQGVGAGAESEEAEAVEEKSTFDLKLQSFDPKAKIKVIKEVRSIAGLGLKDAKELVEGAPATIKKDLKKEEAEELKAKLEELGANIELA